jgi:hypothetical protein
MKIYPATKKSKIGRQYDLEQILLNDKYRNLLEHNLVEGNRSVDQTLRRLSRLIYDDINKSIGLDNIDA